MTAKKETTKKALTLHKHYLVDIRRFKKDLAMTDDSWGKDLETIIVSRNKKRYLALRIAD